MSASLDKALSEIVMDAQNYGNVTSDERNWGDLQTVDL